MVTRWRLACLLNKRLTSWHLFFYQMMCKSKTYERIYTLMFKMKSMHERFSILCLKRKNEQLWYCWSWWPDYHFPSVSLVEWDGSSTSSVKVFIALNEYCWFSWRKYLKYPKCFIIAGFAVSELLVLLSLCYLPVLHVTWQTNVIDSKCH